MRLPNVERRPRLPEPRTANERFRARDRGRLRRCLVLSAAVHVVLVLTWPELTPSAPGAGPPSGASPMELVDLGPVGSPGAGLLAVPVLPEESESPDGDADEEGRAARDDGAAGSAAGGRDRRAEALERIGAVTAGVLERGPNPSTDPRVDPVPVEPAGGDPPPATRKPAATRRDGEDVRIPSASSDLEGRLSDEELMRLERLSSLRPGLAIRSPSDWLVVRNPRAVSEFMRRRFPRTPEGGARGSLSVSLWVDERGSVEWAEINRSSGHPDLDESALELFEEVIAFGPARELRQHVPTAAIFWLTW